VTGPHDDLPPGRLRRGRYLLTGRISVEQAHPTELAYATKHVLTHQEHLAGSADPFHRCREELALAELRMTRAVGTPVTASAGGSVRTRLRPLAFLRDDVNRLLREVGDGDPPRIPTLYDEPVHRDLRA
jgi:hypothetical protein